MCGVTVIVDWMLILTFRSLGSIPGNPSLPTGSAYSLRMFSQAANGTRTTLATSNGVRYLQFTMTMVWKSIHGRLSISSQRIQQSVLVLVMARLRLLLVPLRELPLVSQRCPPISPYVSSRPPAPNLAKSAFFSVLFVQKPHRSDSGWCCWRSYCLPFGRGWHCDVQPTPSQREEENDTAVCNQEGAGTRKISG